MPDTRAWDNRSYAAYMRGRRQGFDDVVPPPAAPVLSTELAALIRLGEAVSTMVFPGGRILDGLWRVLTQGDVGPVGLVPDGVADYRAIRDVRFMVHGAQVTIPEGSRVVMP